MKQRKPVYRLVQNIDGERVSLFVHEPPYKIYYTKNSVVKAAKGSIGIFCFRTKKEALKYNARKWTMQTRDNVEIIKVLPIGRGYTPKSIAYYYTLKCISAFDKWKRKGSIFPIVSKITDEELRVLAPAEGVICYPAVKVLT